MFCFIVNDSSGCVTRFTEGRIMSCLLKTPQDPFFFWQLFKKYIFFVVLGYKPGIFNSCFGWGLGIQRK